MMGSVIVRAPNQDELDQLVCLCAEHAAFERARIETSGLATRLECLLHSPSSLYAWVAVAHARLVGYASASLEVSTWRGAQFVHMDCLYVQAQWRGSGIGVQLIEAVKQLARTRGLNEIQWQTPIWNERAARFYLRLGAVEKLKRRFTLGA